MAGMKMIKLRMQEFAFDAERHMAFCVRFRICKISDGGRWFLLGEAKSKNVCASSLDATFGFMLFADKLLLAKKLHCVCAVCCVVVVNIFVSRNGNVFIYDLRLTKIPFETWNRIKIANMKSTGTTEMMVI